MPGFRRFSIFLLNFFGVLSAHYDQKKNILQVSKIQTIKNLILIPSIFVIKKFLVPKSFHAASVQENLVDLTGLSKFFVLMIGYMKTVLIASIFCIYIQLINQSKVLKFLNKFKYLFEKVPSKFIVKTKITLFLFISNCLIEFCATLKPNWQGFVNFFTARFQDFVILTFCTFFACIFSSIEQKLEDTSKILNAKCVTKAEEIIQACKILKSFNETFGLLLTVLTVFLAVEITFRVIMSINLIRTNQKCIESCFQLFQAFVSLQVTTNTSLLLQVSCFSYIILMSYYLFCLIVGPSHFIIKMVILVIHFIHNKSNNFNLS